MFGFAATLFLLGFIIGEALAFLSLFEFWWTILLGAIYILIGWQMVGKKRPLFSLNVYVSNSSKFAKRNYSYSKANALFIGIFSALAPSPCITPVVSSVALTLPETSLAAQGPLILGFLGLGHSLPIALISLGWRLPWLIDKMQRYASRLNKIIGWSFIVLGNLLISSDWWLDQITEFYGNQFHKH